MGTAGEKLGSRDRWLRGSVELTGRVLFSLYELVMELLWAPLLNTPPTACLAGVERPPSHDTHREFLPAAGYICNLVLAKVSRFVGPGNLRVLDLIDPKCD